MNTSSAIDKKPLSDAQKNNANRLKQSLTAVKKEHLIPFILYDDLGGEMDGGHIARWNRDTGSYQCWNAEAQRWGQLNDNKPLTIDQLHILLNGAVFPRPI